MPLYEYTYPKPPSVFLCNVILSLSIFLSQSSLCTYVFMCLYFLHHFFIFMLSFSLSHAISLFLSQLLMKCPLRIPMCCSLLGNSENREAGRVQRGSFFVMLALLLNTVLISTCAHVCTCVALVQKRASEALC